MNTPRSTATVHSKRRKYRTAATLFAVLNCIACIDALTLGMFSVPPTSALSFSRFWPSTPIDTLFLLTLNVRVLAVAVLVAAAIGLLLKKPWGRSLSIAYGLGMIAFVLVCVKYVGASNYPRPPFTLWWYVVYPVTLVIGMLRYATQLRIDRSDLTDQRPWRFRFRLWQGFVAVGVVCMLFAQIAWWLNHPLDRELFKLKYGGGSVKRSAALALGEMGSDAETAAPALIDAMNDDYHFDYAMALNRIGSVRALVALLKYEPPLYPNPFWPVPALGQHGPAAREAVPILARLLESGTGRGPSGEYVEIKGTYRWDVISALGQIGPDAKSAIKTLTSIVPNPYGQGRRDEWREWKFISAALRQIGLEHLEGQADVETLFFVDSNQPLTDTELEHLEGLTGLRKLGLRGAAISDAGLANLQGMTNLEELWVGGNRTQITDKGLVKLEGLTSLKHLEIWSARVTDLGIEHLKPLASLESLVLTRTKVSDDGIKELQQALPDCSIVH